MIAYRHTVLEMVSYSKDKYSSIHGYIIYGFAQQVYVVTSIHTQTYNTVTTVCGDLMHVQTVCTRRSFFSPSSVPGNYVQCMWGYVVPGFQYTSVYVVNSVYTKTFCIVTFSSFLPEICIALEAVLLKFYAKIAPGWVPT